MKKFLCLFLMVIAFAVTGCQKNSDKVIIYTAMEEERIQAMKEQIEKKFPDKNIVIEHVGTGNLAAKIKTEGSNIEADIIIDLEGAHMENLKDNFADLSKFDQSMYLDGINPSHNKYFMWVKNHAALIIDKDYFEEHNLTVPGTYEDLLDEQYKGLIAMPDPTTSGTGYSYYLNVVNLYGEDKAIEYFSKLSKSNMKQFTESGSGPISLLKQKEIAIAMGMSFQGAAEINNGANYEIIELETGAPYNVTGVSIIKGKETKENVKEVFEWIISDFNKYDKEYFVPGKILKDQTTKVKNYKDATKDADMTGLEDINLKTKLIDKWDI